MGQKADTYFLCVLCASTACLGVLIPYDPCVQGPLYKASGGDGDEDSAVREAGCKGRAVSLLFNLVSKDSILVTAWSGGQLQVDALVDEIQPVWISGSSSRLRMNYHDKIQGVAMICESNVGELPVAISNLPLDQTVWLGHPPPLLRLAVVDLALPTNHEGGSLVTLFADSLLPERRYSLHDGGIDSTVLHSLPFTSQATGRDEALKTPSVHTVLSTCQEESAVCSLLGFASVRFVWVCMDHCSLILRRVHCGRDENLGSLASNSCQYR